MKMFFKAFENLAGMVAIMAGGGALALCILEQQINLRLPLVEYDLNYTGSIAVMAAIMALIARFAAWVCGR